MANNYLGRFVWHEEMIEGSVLTWLRYIERMENVRIVEMVYKGRVWEVVQWIDR